MTPSTFSLSRLTTALLMAAALAAGCSDRERAEDAAAAPAADMASAAVEDMRLAKPGAGAARERQASETMTTAAQSATDATGEPQAQRFLAVRHELSAEVPSDQLPAAWTTVRDLCGTLRCELLSSTMQRETPQQPGHASLEMRVLPADVDAVLGSVAGVAQVVSHNTTSEDKTAEVIDIEAHIRNRTEFRDGLRAMLSDTKTKRDLGDLLAIQSTLADTQAQLDSSATQRKLLAQQTSKQHLTIHFAAKRVLVSGTSYNPIRNALNNASAALAESAGALITFLALALPWLLLAVPAMWIVRLLWRRRGGRAGGAL
ncbi:MAG: DUF4349 domain-containing protein [Variovorax sp.]|nr:MAG: DUF4349 domain-containing protein [Variovorax sp.]